MFGEYAEMSIDRDFWSDEQYYEDVANGSVDYDISYENQIGMEYDIPKHKTIKVNKQLGETEKSLKLETEFGTKWFSKTHCVFRDGFVHVPNWLYNKIMA